MNAIQFIFYCYFIFVIDYVNVLFKDFKTFMYFC